jgi:transaldolase
MQFFIDSAHVADIQAAHDMGLVDGVTTNPTLIKKAGQDHKQTIQAISAIVDGPISVETLGTTADAIYKEAQEYVTWGTNIVIKVVMNAEGLKAVRLLANDGIPTNVTLVFSPLQALLAAKANATYVSPFLGRLDDVGYNGMELIQHIRTIYTNYNYSTRILAASIRHPVHVLEAARIGADVATVPADILKKLFHHPLTDAGIATFMADAKAWSSR